MRRLLTYLVLLLPFLLCAPVLRAQEPEILPAFRVEGLEDRPALELEMRRIAAEARRRIRRRTHADWQGTATIVWLDEQAFMERTNFRPEHTSAAADWRNAEVLINSGAWLRSPLEERQTTMTHEVAHLLIGQLAGGPDLPLWANEGLAMHLAGQWRIEDYVALAQTHASTGLPSLEWLEHRFPDNAPSRQLAYQTSFLAVSALARIEGEDEGVTRLLQILRYPETANPLTQRLRAPEYLRRVEAEMATQLGTRLIAGVIAVSGSGLLLLVASVLVIVAYVKVRRRNAARAEEEVNDESWAESLTEADVQDIYGDREDRWKGDDEDDDDRWRPKVGR